MKFNADFSKIAKTLSENGFSLYPHQKKGVKWLLKMERNGTGGILADDMGLGKTIQIISMLIARQVKTTLIVVPASLVTQWKLEIKKFYPGINLVVHWGDSRINNGTTDKITKVHSSIVLTSYNLISSISSISFDRIICDEAHVFRNRKSKVFKTLYNIRCPIKWAITGTPIQNYKSDIETIFRYIGISQDSLEDNISRYVLRRTKQKVGIELPEIKISVNFTGFKSQDDSRFYEHIMNSPYIHHLEKCLRLRQICVMPESIKKTLSSRNDDYREYKTLNYKKLDRIVKYIKKNKEEKPIVFSYFKHEIEYLQSKLKEYNVGVIYGPTPPEKRSNIIQDKTKEILLIQIIAGGTGLNLQHFNTIYFTAPQWNPTIEQQAIARVHRIGQKTPVKIRRFILGNIKIGTIENRILDIQKKKLEMINGYLQD